jgi:hypothetical protein
MLTQHARAEEWICSYCLAIVPPAYNHKCLEYDKANAQAGTRPEQQNTDSNAVERAYKAGWLDGYANANPEAEADEADWLFDWGVWRDNKLAALASPVAGDVVERLKAALEPFAAMGRVMETRATVTFGRMPPDSEIVCESSGEAGQGVLTMGHFRDAAALLPKAPGWGGMYQPPFDRAALEAIPSVDAGELVAELRDHAGDLTVGYCRAVPKDLVRKAADALEAALLTTSPRYEGLVEALRFYAEAWEQDVDAERTAHGWEGSIGALEPSEALYRDRGDKARTALASTAGAKGETNAS